MVASMLELPFSLTESQTFRFFPNVKLVRDRDPFTTDHDGYSGARFKQ